jgi:hypothetical protein
MPYSPGEHWVCCDLTGKKVLASQTRRTWDGFRVWEAVYYPKHPQLSLRGIPERSHVRDARPEPADVYQTARYKFGSFCLVSLGGIDWTFYITDDGALIGDAAAWGTPQPVFYIDSYGLTVTDDGALVVNSADSKKGPPTWKMKSLLGIEYLLSVAADLALLVTVVNGPDYMDGVFTLTSPDGTNYVVYITDAPVVVTAIGTWGPVSTAFYLGDYVITVSNVGVLVAALSGESHPATYRMISPDGYEYVWTVVAGLVVLTREGHFWNTPVVLDVLAYGKNIYYYDRSDSVAESDQYTWVEE